MNINQSDHLISINGRIFELIGYSNIYDIKEINAKYINYNDLFELKDSRSTYQRMKLEKEKLTINEVPCSFNLEAINAKVKKITTLNIKNKMSTERIIYLENVMLDLLALNSKKHVVKSIGYGYYLVFKLYQKPIDLFNQKVIGKNNFLDVSKNYILKNKFIPLITSPNRAIDILEKNELVKVIDLKLFDRIFNKEKLFKQEDALTIIEKENKEFFNQNEFNILELKKLACIKGGYIDFKYKDHDYKFALLPLLAVSKNNNNKTFEYDKFTWFFSEIKITSYKGFDKPLTDLFLSSEIELKLINDKTFINEIKQLSLQY